VRRLDGLTAEFLRNKIDRVRSVKFNMHKTRTKKEMISQHFLSHTEKVRERH